MFSLENIELDFDEDFSSNIFSKRITSGPRQESEGMKTCSQREVIEVLNQHIQDECSEETKRSEVAVANSELTTTQRENKLKRAHAEDEKPQKKRISCEGLVQRKFPGPAGLLPDKPFKDGTDCSLVVERLSGEEDEISGREKVGVYSQCSGSVFMAAVYQKLVSEFDLRDSRNPLNRYTVEWVKKKALSRGLQGRKIPFLGVIVHAVNHNMPDPVLVLRDPTGEISGSLHREVWAEMGGKLRSGIALALRQVGVLITGVIRRQIYLNITMNNILVMYSSSEKDRQVEVTTVNKVPKAELCKGFGGPEPSRTDALHLLLPSSPFTTVDSLGSRASRELMQNTEEAEKKGGRSSGSGGGADILSDWGVVLSESDFCEEMQVPGSEFEPGRSSIELPARTSTQALSPADSLIFEEVLSGINLDEFEL